MIVLTENEYRDDDFTITKNGRNFILKEYKGNDKIVIVPNYVTVIGENAFYKNKDIVKVIIKEGVTKIENCAFYCCNKLEYIEIPTTLKFIEGAVFYFCKNLKEIKLNDGLTEIGFASFQGCLKLTKLELPDTLVYIGEDAFLNCSDLKFNVYDNAKYLGGKTNPYLYLFKVVRTNIKSCKIHNDTKFIGSESFKFCSNLDEIIIPNGVKRIGNSAFCYCTKIERINIPDSVVFIGNSAFSNCDNLLSVNLPSNLNNINDSLFCNSGKLETVVIPDNVKTIERLAFSYCENLKSIKLSKNLEILNYWVFSNCKKLDYVEIPKDIKTIDNYAFEDCEQLNITYYGNMYFHSFEKSLNSIYAPNIPLNSISPNQKEKYIEGFFKNYNDIKNMDAENFKRYLKYIKTNRIKYYDAFNENVCKFMVENKIIKLEEVDALIKKTTYSNHIELSAMLLDYKNKNFSSEEIEKQIEKDLFEEKIISFSNLKSLWIVNKLENENYSIYGYKGKNSEIEIPYKFEKGFVEKFSLHKKVDTQVSEYLNKITKVVIQEGVKEILSKGFYCCDSLEFVQIPESVEIIGDRAFVNDKNLVSLKVPSSVKYIGEYAFANCDNLTLEVEKNSYAEKYAIDNEIKYIIY